MKNLSNILTIIVLTYNEEANLEKCINNIKKITNSIIIVDSYSDDKTEQIAKDNKVFFFKNNFINQGIQFNWALDNINIKNDWIMRVDADEIISDVLINKILNINFNNKDIAAYSINKRIYWMNKWIKYGGIYPMKITRIFKRGTAKYEEFTEEHLIVKGNIMHINYDIIENNKKNNLIFFTTKHLKTAVGEVNEFFDKKKKDGIEHNIFGGKAERTRWLKLNIFNNAPIFLRCLLYFFYRYIIRLGFLDGRKGLIFHFLQGFWYRFLIDSMIYEKKNNLNVINEKKNY